MEAEWTSLVNRILAGDPAAEEELCSRLYRGIQILLFRHLGGPDLSDETQTIVQKLIENIRSGYLREPEALPSYLRSMVLRHAASCVQARAVARPRELPIENAMHSACDCAPDPAALAEHAEVRKIISSVMEELSPTGREVMNRFYVLEEDMETICRDLGLTNNQFRLLKSRMKVKVAELFQRRLRPSLFPQIHVSSPRNQSSRVSKPLAMATSI